MELAVSDSSVSRKRGRPASGNALSPAERQRLRRQRLAEEGKGALSVHVPQDLIDRVDAYVFERGDDVTKDDVVEKALRAFFRRR